ncbi:MAG TPA: Stf0 family sulfotransferase [Solirubrobacteraceae bacterium]
MQAYLVCATPRSGSTLLCERLRDTGLAGRPLEHFEILRHSSLPRQPRECFGDLDLHGLDELLPPPRSGTPIQEPPEAWRARILRQGRGESGVWGGKLMWGHVEDLVTRASQLPGQAEASYEYAAIDHFVSQLESNERSWKEWFARTGQRPFVVTYDQLEAAPAETVATVLHPLGLPDASVSGPRLSHQRDDVSAAWVERYRQERGEAA